jgi:hypothetical protein
LSELDLIARLHKEKTVFPDVRLLYAPAQAAPGKAYVEVGLYQYKPGSDRAALDRISIVDDQGQAVADRVDLGAVWIGAGPAAQELPDLQRINALFDDRIELAGGRTQADPDAPQRLLVELAWRAADRSTTDYTAFVHLLDEAGQIIAQHDAPPGGVDNPTGRWAPGEVVRSVFPLELPGGTNAAAATLRIGLYEPVSGRQLPVTASGDPQASADAQTYVLLAPEQLEAGG